jgi:hypothetical protein
MYRKLLLTCVVTNSDNFHNLTEFVESNVPGSVLWFVDMWNKANLESITRCFARACFMVNCFASHQKGKPLKISYDLQLAFARIRDDVEFGVELQL